MKKILLLLTAILLVTAVCFAQSTYPPASEYLKSITPPLTGTQRADQTGTSLPTTAVLTANGDWCYWNPTGTLLYIAWNEGGAIKCSEAIWGYPIIQPTHGHTYAYYNSTSGIISWDSVNPAGITLTGDAYGPANADTVAAWWAKPLDRTTFKLPSGGGTNAPIPIYNFDDLQWETHQISLDGHIGESGSLVVQGWDTKALDGSFSFPPANSIPLWDTGGGSNKWYPRQLTGGISINDTGYVTLAAGAAPLYGISPIQIHGGDSVGINLVAGSGISIAAGATADTIKTNPVTLTLGGDVTGPYINNLAHQFHGDTNSITANVTLTNSSATCWLKHDSGTSPDTMFLPKIGSW